MCVRDPSGEDRRGLELVGVCAGAEGVTGRRGFPGFRAVRRARSRSAGAGRGRNAQFGRDASRFTYVAVFGGAGRGISAGLSAQVHSGTRKFGRQRRCRWRGLRLLATGHEEQSSARRALVAPVSALGSLAGQASFGLTDRGPEPPSASDRALAGHE